ncbi:MAG: nitrite/sulfite reductase [Gammaproteobacteria bacterium]|nr:nitrite/sulfite reductase [Gammaproteobacteria bacterium]
MTQVPGDYVDSDELDRYEDAVLKYHRGEIDENKLMVTRLQQGVYGQRQDGVNMVRIKVPGGRLSPQQLQGIGSILEQYSGEDIVSITTRQDIQIHSVALGDTPAVLRELADMGLTTREACGNTVRNICACPLAGVCEREHVNVQPFIEQTVEYFLRHPLTQHMPRKFKMSFSGCEVDCAQGMIHDVGVVAVSENNRFGFKVLAAGGLGHKPREAVVIESFIEEADLLPVIEAVIAVHNKYSDRKKRAKSRIKFLVDRFGADGFVEKYREEVKRTREAYTDNANHVKGEWQAGCGDVQYYAGAPHEVVAQKQLGLFVFPIAISLGDLTSKHLRGIAKLLIDEKIDDVRTTQDQNLILVGVPEHSLSSIRSGLTELGLAEPVVGDNVVACPGTWTCRLGITSSRNVAQKLTGSAGDLLVRVSGCQNGCAQPTVGDIGIHGEAKRIHGKLIPHYRMHFGGDGRAGGRIGTKGPEVPAARVDKAINRIQETFLASRENNESFLQWNGRQTLDYYKELLADLIHVSASDVPLVLKDHGDKKDFKVLQLGGGECAGVSQEDVAANFSEAAMERSYLRSFLLARKYQQAIDCAVAITRLVGQSLLRSAGKAFNLDEPQEIAAKIKEYLPSHPYLFEPLAVFIGELNRFEHSLEETGTEQHNFDQSGFERLLKMLNGWTVLAGHYCQEKNQAVDFSSSLPETQLTDLDFQDPLLAASLQATTSTAGATLAAASAVSTVISAGSPSNTGS